MNESDIVEKIISSPENKTVLVKPNVLVVDDLPANLVAMTKVLKPLDITLHKANSGNEALALAMEHDFAVILLDVQMPDMDGFETATYLREYERSQNTPIVFVTAISKEPSNVFEGYESGAVDYLFKPIDSRVLRSKVKVFVDLFKKNHNQLSLLVRELEKAKSTLEDNNRQLEEIARKDALTSLPNRYLFDETFTQVLASHERNDKHFALMLLDVDKFKSINDTHGHDVGDLVLKHIAEQITACIRVNDITARLGGDEFAILLTDIGDDHQAGMVANKIIRATNDDFDLGTKKIKTGISIGIACFPGTGDTMEQLFKSADVALYKSKRLGRNRASFYTNDLNNEYAESTKIENDLLQAIKDDELKLAYIPIFDIRTKKVISIQPQITWLYSDDKIMGYQKLRRIANQAGLEDKLTNWVISNISQDYAKWYKLYGQHISYTISLSYRQLEKSTFLDSISKLEEETKIPSSQIVFEVSEPEVITENCNFRDMYSKVKENGFKVSICNFGKGYSSIALLQDVRIDFLKIHPSFIADSNNTAIAESIMSLANKLDIDIIAEGVENEWQEDFLSTNNCYFAQGTRYSEPLEFKAMSEFLKNY